MKGRGRVAMGASSGIGLWAKLLKLPLTPFLIYERRLSEAPRKTVAWIRWGNPECRDYHTAIPLRQELLPFYCRACLTLSARIWAGHLAFWCANQKARNLDNILSYKQGTWVQPAFLKLATAHLSSNKLLLRCAFMANCWQITPNSQITHPSISLLGWIHQSFCEISAMSVIRLAVAENSLSNGIQNRLLLGEGGRLACICKLRSPQDHLESPRLPWVSVIHYDPQKLLRADALTFMVYHSESIQIRISQRKSTWAESRSALPMDPWTPITWWYVTVHTEYCQPGEVTWASVFRVCVGVSSSICGWWCDQLHADFSLQPLQRSSWYH